MPITRNNIMPMAKCPHCGGEFQWDDYYDLKGDNESRDCRSCGKPVYCTEMEPVMYVTLSTEPSA